MGDPFLQVLQLQCIIDSKDREITALRSHLSGAEVAPPSNVNREEVGKLSKQAAEFTTHDLQNGKDGGAAAAEILQACQQMCLALEQQIQQAHSIVAASQPGLPALMNPTQQHSAARSSVPASSLHLPPAPASAAMPPRVTPIPAPVPASASPAPAALDHAAAPSSMLASSSHQPPAPASAAVAPSAAPAPAPTPAAPAALHHTTPSSVPASYSHPPPLLDLHALAQAAGLFDVLELELSGGQVVQAVRGALLLGGPTSSLHR
ncbi:hypothetical protein DUNSADRAFT_6605 [Dunaliella salina]|uniref:Uncharacterized protein n=1 Tax=Dunaliella salina TaxID=3046 RepID=A0ABQ7GN02_DUNSA|nr:hypothetical protein DUNSADRAFT_6605 [Dunaliella salina]|eukprot:KAF5835989.1 hypothetical protein DUNSADRAFT_6605 [Dunaliella salina]